MIETVFLRWPSRLKVALERLAEKQGTSIQTIVTEILLDRFGIANWRESKGVRNREKRIEDILKYYDYVPKDVEEAIEEAKFNRKIGGVEKEQVRESKSQVERMREVELVGRNWRV